MTAVAVSVLMAVTMAAPSMQAQAAVAGSGVQKTDETAVTQQKDRISGTDGRNSAFHKSSDGRVYEYTRVNPVYEDLYDVSDLPKTDQKTSGQMQAMSTGKVYRSASSAGKYMRKQMKARKKTITLRVNIGGYKWNRAGASKMVGDIVKKAMAHTGNPKEGDYIAFQYRGYSASMRYTTSGIRHRKYDGVLKYTVSYMDTASQEKRIDKKLKQVMPQLDLAGKSDFERVATVYTYIISQVSYDYDSYNHYRATGQVTESAHSAYGALIKHKAVCQGYAVLLYRMCLTAGVDCRVISGTGNGEAHAWDIVRLGSFYYNVDSTWDSSAATVRDNTIYAPYFLCSDKDFKKHVRSKKYRTAKFYRKYPMAAESYLK